MSPWLLLAMSGMLAAFFLVALRAGLRARQLPVLDPLMRLPGALGIAASPLAPEGTVRVQRETWSAVSCGEMIEPGEEVEVLAREGLTLHVRRMRPKLVRASGRSPRKARCALACGCKDPMMEWEAVPGLTPPAPSLTVSETNGHDPSRRRRPCQQHRGARRWGRDGERGQDA